MRLQAPLSIVATLFVAFIALNIFASPTVRSGGGLAAATAARDQFRADIGGGTVAGANGSFGGVRREINWDDVPDAFAAPNRFPADFFNANSPRGVAFSTPGSGFQVSAALSSGTPVRFANLDPGYAATFVTFSSERLFTALGSAVTDVHFFLPGTNVPAAVSAFGVMFSDVDVDVPTRDAVVPLSEIQLLGADGQFLGSFIVPMANHDVSFLGISFPRGERIARVRIIAGNIPLASDTSAGDGAQVCVDPAPGCYVLLDAVALDDFIYSEPVVAVGRARAVR